MPRIKFSITEAHITKSRRLIKKNGNLSRSEACPTALALKSVLGSKTRVEVGPDSFDLFTNDDTFLIALPVKVHKFIQDFDLDKIVKPLDFTVNLKKAYLPKTFKAAA